MGEGQEAGEESGGIVWQSKSYENGAALEVQTGKRKSSLIPAKKAALEAIY